ncbi:MAG TPA: DUF4124 domain-containing protein [Burkholderiales bacterium]|nr:DUF4124 domain-containing protein [Burkholderiales bacterium]
MKQVIGVILVLMSGTVYGQLYKCIDKSGGVEYANACPPGTRQQATGIRSSPGASPSAAAPQKSFAEQDAEFRKRQIEKQEGLAKQEKKAAQDAQRQRNCDNARSNLQGLQMGGRIARVDPKTGERVYLDDKDIQQGIAEAQRAVDANCK